MSFKEIRLDGFKSFADKTKIEFEHGFTGIVGPNGCGKSNVADAVRWVIGESSAKNMRGSSMQDVIFSGTEKRKPTSMCEVTLVFDNSDKTFNIDYSEVSLTRRLYRNGESEYLINNKSCRKKAIVNLLHGVGIGKEGYSIIGQGKVEQIMNSKPQERRAIFEEATGIVIFKEKKIETERRLAETKDNLNTYLMRMEEVKRQVDALEKQAESARKYNALFSELKQAEVNLYIVRYEGAEVSKTELFGKISEVDMRIAAMQAEVAELDEKIEEARTQIAQSDAELAALNDQLLIYTVNIEKKSGEARVIRERIHNAWTQLAEAGEIQTASQARLSEIAEEIARSETAQNADQNKLSELAGEAQKLEARLAELNEQIAEFERKEEEHRRDVLSNVEDLSDLKANMGSLSAQQDAVNARIAQIQSDREKSDSKLNVLRYKYDECIRSKAQLAATLDGEKDELDRIRREQADCDASGEALSQQIYSLTAQVNSAKQNLQMYIGMKDRMEGYKGSVRKLLMTAKSNASVARSIKGVIADIIRCDKKFEVAIETSFGASMQDIVTDTQDDARYLIEHLKRTGGGIATFRPVSLAKPHNDSFEAKRALNETGALGLATQLVQYDKYFEKVISSLIGNTLICDNIANATAISKRYPSQFRIVTLDGDVISTGGSMTGGSRRSDGSNLLANERKIQETKDLIERQTVRLGQLIEQRKQALAEKGEKVSAADKIREKYTNVRTELAAVTQRQAQLEQRISEAEAELIAQNTELEALNARLGELANMYSSTTVGEKLIQTTRAATEDEIARNAREYAKYKQEREKKLARYNALLVERAALESAVRAAEENKDRLNAEREQLAARIADAEKRSEQLAVNIRLLEKSAEEKAFTDEEKAVVTEMRNRIEGVDRYKRERNEAILAFENTKMEKLNAVSEENKNRYGLELQISKIDSDLAAFGDRIRESYGIEYADCLPLREENFDAKAAQTLVNRNRRQINALGPVNLHSIADYEEENARYQEMLVQKNDLEQAMNDLSSVLEQLRDEMQKQFDQGFNRINANFVQIFKELFGGGKAHLELDYSDCEDVLDAGVEIFACPPGKNLTKISLLSGGERALTAIAILFAILKLRPMPLCILDEIEAALDETNGTRFAKYLHRFSKDTQFIVITHRKPTMEEADVLYGVTMEEKGISKVISVKLADVNDKLGKSESEEEDT